MYVTFAKRSIGLVRFGWLLWIAATIGPCPDSARAQDQDTESRATAAALGSIFNVERAPRARSMGLFQANFLDSIQGQGKRLQLAVVVDATESMTDELDSIRESLPLLVEDLGRIKDGKLETTVVAYSDVGESESPVKILSPNFLPETSDLAQVVGELRNGTGKPYFPEAVDLGIYTAIHDLAWSTDENVEKWILLIGDAPPFDPSFFEESTKARRWYETDFLVDLANKNNIRIHCLLCASRSEEQEAYQKTLDKTRRFMSELSNGTGGQILDLSYPAVQKQLVEAARGPEPNYVRVGYITQSQIDAVKKDLSPAAESAPPEVRLVVLPFLPMESMSFFYEKPEVQLATELRQSLRALPGVRAVSPRQLEDEVGRLQGEGVPVADWPQALCIRLRADYVLHGTLRTAGGEAFATTWLHGRNQAEPLGKLGTSSTLSTLAQAVLADLRNVPAQNEGLRPLLVHVGQLDPASPALVDASGMLAQLNPEERSLLLGAFEALDQALGYQLGDPAGEELLSAVERQLDQFLKTQPDHAFAHVLLASCLFNRASLLEKQGLVDESQAARQKSLNEIGDAWRLRNSLVDRLTRLEVEGDYHLLVTGDIAAAIQSYNDITAFAESSPVRPALRAHWILAGIYAGGWDVAAKDAAIVNPDKSRGHLLRILAGWPDSTEAMAIKRFLLWDEQTDRSRTPWLPAGGDLVATNQSDRP